MSYTMRRAVTARIRRERLGLPLHKRSRWPCSNAGQPFTNESRPRLRARRRRHRRSPPAGHQRPPAVDARNLPDVPLRPVNTHQVARRGILAACSVRSGGAPGAERVPAGPRLRTATGQEGPAPSMNTESPFPAPTPSGAAAAAAAGARGFGGATPGGGDRRRAAAVPARIGRRGSSGIAPDGAHGVSVFDRTTEAGRLDGHAAAPRQEAV